MTNNRRSIRLRNFDYSSGGVDFVTVCSHQRECVSGEIIDGEMKLSSAGEIVTREWMRTPLIRQDVEIDEFVVMPNHLHGVLVLLEQASGRGTPAFSHKAGFDGRKPGALGSLIAGFKSASTKQVNALRGTAGMPLWQRNYFEHVVRNEQDLERVRSYIQANVARWAEDVENPGNARQTELRAAVQRQP